MKPNLYEHQSAYNPNLPLRFLFYTADLYSEITKDANLYSTRLLRLPTPRFLVFYNGVEERPDKEVLKLSGTQAGNAGSAFARRAVQRIFSV